MDSRGRDTIKEKAYLVERSLRVLPHELLNPNGILLADGGVPAVENYSKKRNERESVSDSLSSERVSE